MAFSIDEIKEYWTQNWKYDNYLGGSRLAILFPNILQQDGGQLNTVVKFPVMRNASTQKDYAQETGFTETDAHEYVVEMKLERNFTSYTKIAKINISGPDWAANKMNVIETQEAAEVDECALEKIGKGVKHKVNIPVKINKDNIIAEIKKMEKQAKKQKFRLENGIILISSEVMTTLIESKLSSVTQNIENTNSIVTRILNKYYVVEADIDEYGFQMIGMLPSAYAWASYVDIPLQSGEYTQGSFLGQIFTAVNKFYNGEVIMPEHILGYADPNVKPETVGWKGAGDEEIGKARNAPTSDNNLDESLDNYKTMKLNELISTYEPNSRFKKFIEKTSEIIQNSQNAEKVNNAYEYFVAKMK